MTTKGQIKTWLDKAREVGATHMLVSCDTFDWEDYPVFVKQGQNVSEVADEYDMKNMQKLMECYNLSMDLDMQINEARAWNF